MIEEVSEDSEIEQNVSRPATTKQILIRAESDREDDRSLGSNAGSGEMSLAIWQLPRFPINEKYGDLKRFNSLINYNPLEYKSLKPVEKKLENNDNPPQLIVEFFDNQKNIKNNNCYSNDGGSWGQPNLVFEKNILYINFESKFLPRRGRINCSLNDNGKWRWFGTQFVIMEN